MTPATPENTCGRCDARWGGLKTAHCATCHHTFTSITAFDKHRTGPADARTCLTPTDVGLIDAGRGYPCWGQPGMEGREYGVA